MDIRKKGAHGFAGIAATLVALLATATVARAVDVDITKFSGHITDVGIQRGPGQVGGVEYRVRGHFEPGTPLDLSTAKVTLERLFDEPGAGGAGELMTMMDDVPFLPYELLPRTGAPNRVVYDTPDFRPQIRLQIWELRGGYEFRLKLDRGLMRRRPLLCTDDPTLSTTDIATAFTIDDGIHPPVRVTTLQPWECNPKDNNLRSRGRRSPSAPPPPGATPSPRPTPTPLPPSCPPLANPPVAQFHLEALTRNSGAPDSVELDASSSVARVGTIVRYLFEPGLGVVSDGADPRAVFVFPPGDYGVRLTVFDDRGACTSVTRSYSEK